MKAVRSIAISGWISMSSSHAINSSSAGENVERRCGGSAMMTVLVIADAPYVHPRGSPRNSVLKLSTSVATIVVAGAAVSVAIIGSRRDVRVTKCHGSAFTLCCTVYVRRPEAQGYSQSTEYRTLDLLFSSTRYQAYQVGHNLVVARGTRPGSRTCDLVRVLA